MPRPKEKSIDVALELTKQLLTISAAFIPVFFALREIIDVPEEAVVWFIYSASAFFMSIVMGIAVYGGIVNELKNSKDYDVVDKKNVRIPAQIQWIFFLAGVVLMTYALYLCFLIPPIDS